jgi:hypothetical protein
MDTFSHIKAVISITLGLSITHLLKGAAKQIQHPGRDKPYWVHNLWTLYVFILLLALLVVGVSACTKLSTGYLPSTFL